MLPRTLLQVVSFLGLMSGTNAHHMLTNIIIGGVDQGDGNSIRIPPNTNPVVDIQSTDMACNVDGLKSVKKSVSINAGDTVTMQWRTYPDGSQNIPIADSHQGPCAVYMKNVNSFTDPPNGPGWVKIWHDGFRDGEFCTERLRASGGKMSVTIPKDFAGGRYFIRAEHLALHQGQNIGGAQWYIGCVQAIVYSTGGNAHPKGVSIPGYCDANHPGVHFDYWSDMKPKSYSIPGPAPYVVTNAGGGQRIHQDFKEKKTDCPISNADWCSAALPPYTDEGSCWGSSGNCWQQLDVCYNTAPPTGHKGCTEFEKYCSATQEQCKQCAARRTCRGSFPPAKRGLSPRSDKEDSLQERRTYRRVRRTSTPIPAPVFEKTNLDKKAMAARVCVLIYENCKNQGVFEGCGLFAQACAYAIEKDSAEQFPDKAEKKWQALWLLQSACENEGLHKDICRDTFSGALEGFE